MLTLPKYNMYSYVYLVFNGGLNIIRTDQSYKCNFLESNGDGAYVFDDKQLNGGKFSVSFNVIANRDVRIALSPIKEEHNSMIVICE